MSRSFIQADIDDLRESPAVDIVHALAARNMGQVIAVRFSLFAIVALGGRFLALPLTFGFVRHMDDVTIAVAIQSGTAVLSGLLSLLAARRLELLRAPNISLRSIRMRIVESPDMFVATASVGLFSATNAIILGASAVVITRLASMRRPTA